MGRLRYILCGLVLLVVAPAWAMRDSVATTGRWCIEADYLTGNIIRHSKKIKEIPTDWTQGFELSVLFKTFGARGWHKPLHYPEVGAGLEYLRFGYPAVFGDAVALMGMVKFYMVRSKVVDADRKSVV